MDKYLVFIRANSDGDRSSLAAQYREKLLPEAFSIHSGIKRCHLNVLEYISGQASVEDRPADIVLEIWSDEYPQAILAAHVKSVEKTSIYKVVEYIEKDTLVRKLGRTPGLKWVAPLRPAAHLAPSAVKQRWDRHVALALHAHPCDSYVRNWIDYNAGEPESYFGVAMLHFPSEAVMRRPYRDAASEAAVAKDVSEFVSWVSPMVMTEEVVLRTA